MAEYWPLSKQRMTNKNRCNSSRAYLNLLSFFARGENILLVDCPLACGISNLLCDMCEGYTWFGDDDQPPYRDVAMEDPFAVGLKVKGLRAMELQGPYTLPRIPRESLGIVGSGPRLPRDSFRIPSGDYSPNLSLPGEFVGSL
jgi:hypothetical protein